MTDTQGQETVEVVQADLLPCPFCGGEAWLFKHSSAYTDEYSVRCGEKGCCEVGDEFERDAIAAWNTRITSTQPVGEVDEVMSVTLGRDGTVTSHNAYDADFDAMVHATQTIVEALQKRLSDRKFCPYSHGATLRSGPVPVGEVDTLREALAWYGEQSRLARLIHSEGDAGRHALQADGGKRAQAALAGEKGNG